MQGVIQARLAQLLRSEVQIVGSSRTDTGVHARQQFAHIDLASDLDIHRLHHQLNAVLPRDVAVEAIRPVSAQAHARFDAVARTYLYTIVRRKSPFQQETSYRLRGALDITKMNEAAAILCRKQDFQSLCRVRPVDQHFLCNVTEAHWLVQEDQFIFHIKANRFLRSMVRIIVSLLLKVGRGTLSLLDFEALIDKKERDLAVSLVPAHGLALIEVAYPENLFIT